MSVPVNITPTAPTDGVTYCSGAALPSTEADLLSPAVPVAGTYTACILAIIELTVGGGPSGNTTYVVMQTDLGDGAWVDVAWIVLTSTTNGVYTFVLSAGVAGAGAFQQSRANGSSPGSSGSNQCPLGRVRFTGQATLTGGSSPTVTAKILYKQLGLR